MELWTALGVSILNDLLLKDILLKLGKESLEDYVKDFFKDCIKTGVQSAQPDILKKALGEALQQFLQLIEDELLVECELTEAEVRDTYQIAIGRFLQDDEVKPLLGKAFEKNCRGIDDNQLRIIWRQRYSPDMPTGFNWDGIANQYVKDVKRIVRNSPELKELLELEILESIEQQVRDNAGISPDFNITKYQEGLRERYSHLNLSSLDTTGCAYNELKLGQVFIPQNVRQVHQVLPQVYELPKEHQRRLRESHLLDADVSVEELTDYKQVYSQQPICPINEIINDKDNYRYLVILGDPGSGKSTLLQYLALDWANYTPNDANFQPIPLLIELRTYMRNRDAGQCKNFLEFFHDSSGIVCHLNQRELVEQLKAGNALVMFDGLDEVFDPGKREDVITDIHRFTNDYPDVRVIVTSRVIGYKPQRLRDAEFYHFMLQDLEANQVKEFITRWHDLTFTNQVDKQRKRERLQRAIDTSKAIRELAGNPLLLTMMAILNRNQELQGILTKYLKTLDINNSRAVARVMIKQLRERNFILCFMGADYYAFVHRTFLEYFCAWEYVWQFEKERTISLEELKTEVFGKHWQDESWHEVLRLIVGMIEPKLAGEILDYLRNQPREKQSREEGRFINVFLAADCLSEVRNRSVIASTATQLLNQLKGLTQYDLHYYYEPSSMREFILVREIRIQAVAAIATTWHDSPDTLPWLKQKAQSDDDSTVRQAAVQELAKGWKDDPNTLPILKQKARSDRHHDVRHAAVQELAKGWKNDPDTLPWLKQKAKSDDQWDVRYAAVKELAKGWKNDPDTLPILKQKAQSDDDWRVRLAAVEELAKGWKDEPWLFELLRDRALNDPFVREKDWQNNPRQLALHIIIKQYPNHPQTLPLLRDRAENDPDEKVRGFAQNKLAQFEKQKSDI